MKNIRQLFINKAFLLEEAEVEALVEHCEKLQDEIVDFKLKITKTKS